MSSELALVARLISDSQQLLALAESEQWQQFTEQEQQRQAAIKQLDLRDIQLSEQQNNELRAQMQALIALNSQIETLCREKRDEIAAQLKTINQGNKAKKAYT